MPLSSCFAGRKPAAGGAVRRRGAQFLPRSRGSRTSRRPSPSMLNPKTARAIARAIRERDGGLRGIRALGLRLPSRGHVQLPINISEPDRVPLHRELELDRGAALLRVELSQGDRGTTVRMTTETEQARAILKQLEGGKEYVSPEALADLYVALGEREQAFASLERAYAAHDAQLQFLRVDPNLDTLRADPRFTELMRRVGLTP